MRHLGNRASQTILDAIRAASQTAGGDKLSTPVFGRTTPTNPGTDYLRDEAQRGRITPINELKALIVTSLVAFREELRSLELPVNRWIWSGLKG